jgi:uncharacterized protein YxjI
MAHQPQALPPPGLAIFSKFVSSSPQTLYMKGEAFSSDFSLTWADGRPFIHVDSESFSLSRRKNIIDSSTGNKLCTIRREHFSRQGTYYAETSDDGPRLFEVEKTSHWGKTKFSITFPNANAGGQSVSLDYKATSSFKSREGTITWNGTPVAYVERESSIKGSRYRLHIAPGVDPFVVAGLVVAIDAYVRAQQAAAGGGGALI